MQPYVARSQTSLTQSSIDILKDGLYEDDDLPVDPDSIPELPSWYASKYDPYHVWVNHWYLSEIEQAIWDAMYGDGPKYIIVNIPSQHLKSTLISKWTPVAVIDHNPRANVMVACYSTGYAEDWGGAVSDVFLTHQHQMNAKLASKRPAKKHWRTTKGGGMVAQGRGGQFVGRPGDLIIVDDPYRGFNEASSHTVRQQVWAWWDSEIYTRRTKDAVFVIVHTRWHPDDLTGRLLKEQPERWHHISYPALAVEDEPHRKEGEALNPDLHPVEEHEETRRYMARYRWAAMYQQDPYTQSGGKFDTDKLNYVEEWAPADAQRVRVWDLASTRKSKKSKDPDFTSGVLTALYKSELTVEDVERGQWGVTEARRRIEETAELDGTDVVIGVEEEKGPGSKYFIHELRKALPAFRIVAMPANGSKEQRAVLAQDKVGGGLVNIVRGDWNEDFVEELDRFGEGGHDDQVDSFSYDVIHLVGNIREPVKVRTRQIVYKR